MVQTRDPKTAAVFDNGAAHDVGDDRSSVKRNRYETTIGYAAGLTGLITFSVKENVRAYRLQPSADMRYVEDAVNVAQAELMLNTAAAQSATIDNDVPYSVARFGTDAGVNAWSDWVELDKSNDVDGLRRLWFGLDAAGTGGTVIVEVR